MEDVFLGYMQTNCNGKKNAVKARYLQMAFNINGRAVRRIVNRLRQQGHPICSGNEGYWYSTDKAEIEATIGRMVSTANTLDEAIKGLVLHLNDFETFGEEEVF